MESFFVAALERKLKDLFICGSGSRADNPLVNAHRPSVACHWWPETGSALRIARKTALMALLLAGLAWPAAQGSDKGDHERAREAVQAGQVLSLPILLQRLERSHPGQVLELELEREDGRWIYEIRLLQASGQLLKLELDAATGQVLKTRRKEDRKPERTQQRAQESTQEQRLERAPDAPKDRLK